MTSVATLSEIYVSAVHSGFRNFHAQFCSGFREFRFSLRHVAVDFNFQTDAGNFTVVLFLSMCIMLFCGHSIYWSRLINFQSCCNNCVKMFFSYMWHDSVPNILLAELVCLVSELYRYRFKVTGTLAVTVLWTCVSLHYFIFTCIASLFVSFVSIGSLYL